MIWVDTDCVKVNAPISIMWGYAPRLTNNQIILLEKTKLLSRSRSKQVGIDAIERMPKVPR